MQTATPAACTTGSWAQKFQCALHQPASTSVSHAGYTAGHSAAPILLAAIAVVVLWIMLTGRKKPAVSK